MKKHILIPAIIIAALGYQGISLTEQVADLQTEVQAVQEENAYLQECVVAYEEAASQNYYEVPLTDSVQRHIYAASHHYNIDPRLVLAVIDVESSFDAAAISSTNDYGLMQINKCNHEKLSQTLGVDNFLDPYQNIEAGTYMLSNYLHKHKDPHKALMAYNMGEGGAGKHWAKGKTTSSYSETVLSKYNEYIGTTY